MKIRTLVLMAILVLIPSLALSCNTVGCQVVIEHQHESDGTVIIYKPISPRVIIHQAPQVIIQQPLGLIDIVDRMMYVSSGATKMVSDYYNIRTMGHIDDRMGIRNDILRDSRYYGHHRPIHHNRYRDHRGGSVHHRGSW